MPRRRERSRRSYTALAPRGHRRSRRIDGAAGGCSMFAQREQAADDLVTGSITPHPVTAGRNPRRSRRSAPARSRRRSRPQHLRCGPAAAREMLARVVNDAPPLRPAWSWPRPIARPCAGPSIGSDRSAAGRARPWLNTATGVGGLIVPVSERFRQGGATCRRVRVSVIRGTRTDWLAAHACRRTTANGRWSTSRRRVRRTPEGGCGRARSTPHLSRTPRTRSPAVRDPYDVLGVPRGRTKPRSRRRSAARQAAPSRHERQRPEGAARLREVNQAYEIVGDKGETGEVRRGEIDAEGKAALRRRPLLRRGPGRGFGPFRLRVPGPDRAAGGGGPPRGSTPPTSSPISSPAGDAAARARAPRRGANLNRDARGRLRRGRPRRAQGISVAGRDLEVAIPAGIESGKQMRLRGQGRASLEGGEPATSSSPSSSSTDRCSRPRRGPEARPADHVRRGGAARVRVRARSDAVVGGPGVGAGR